ncbi:Copper-transporting ATPase [Fusarium oxysporum f. sp. albedinis]|nr:Copper-transporting ATPase [Fusarium oxysporum f. sp. albedinis]
MISCAIYPSLLSLPFPSQIRAGIVTEGKPLPSTHVIFGIKHHLRETERKVDIAIETSVNGLAQGRSSRARGRLSTIA